MLRWLRANGCPWNADVCAAAAEGGHFSLLKWARAEGCPWDERVCNQAASNGRLGMLVWARENGGEACPWSERTYEMARHADWWDCQAYLDKVRCPGSLEARKQNGEDISAEMDAIRRERFD